MEGGDSEFANFTLRTLMAFLEARSQNVSGNNNLLLMDAPKRILSMNSQSSGQPKNDAKTQPPSPFHGNFLQLQQYWHLYCFTILGSTSTVIYSVKQRLLRNWPGNALRLLATSCAKEYKAHSL